MGKILRRTFLIGTAAIAGGVAFGAWYVKKPYANPLEGRLEEGEKTFNPFIKITQENRITIIVPRAEMGQGVTTSLAALVAEELDVEMADIEVEHGPASSAYYNAAMLEDGSPFPHYQRGFLAETTRDALGTVGKVLGLQVTGGSSATKDAFVKMREAGCMAREMLKQAAANRSGLSFQELSTERGSVIAGGERYTYGDLAADAAKLDPPSNMVLKPKADWRILGKSQPRTDVPAKVTGKAVYGSDIRLPGMLYATVRMNPRLGGSMVRFDPAEALNMPGILKVIDMTGAENEKFGGGFAVIATNSWAAFQGADAVDVEWGDAPYPPTTADQFAALEAAFDDEALRSNARDDGDADLAFADAPRDRVVEAEYRVPYLAHSCMEPMNATAWLRDGKLDVWTGTQAPTIVLGDVAYEAGVEKDAVEIHTTFLGGGFGRRAEVDFPRYATRVARFTDGKPVQVVWTREEDMTHDTYRPAAIGRYRARMGDDGTPQALVASLSTPSIIGSLMARTFPSMSPAGPDATMFQGASDQPYRIENWKVDTAKAGVDIPIGFWRSVGHSYNAFFLESFIDEMAHAGDADPLDYRLAMLAGHPEAIAVLKKVADMASWTGGKGVDGKAQGIAFHLSFGAWTAQVIEVSQREGAISIDHVWCACDLGTVLDPAIVKAQMQSAIVYGLSSAMGQEITFEDGMVQQTNFHDYDAMRIHQCPRIDVEIVSNAEHMGGAGEPGTPPSIPALANAIFALTGKRIRTMPLAKEVEFVA